MYCYGGIWTGTDISEEQIEQAKHLSAGMNIDYKAVATEKIDFPAESFDVITACQCFWYFDHESVMPNLYRMLKPGRKLLALYMAWLPTRMKLPAEVKNLYLNIVRHGVVREKRCTQFRFQTVITHILI